jgi:hypothetical protein
MIEQIRALLAKCSAKERHQIFEELKATVRPHAFEVRMYASADVILAALDRANEMSLRGIRGLIGEATFVLEVAPSLTAWENMSVIGDLPYDAALRDGISTVTVQVKMQRRKKGAAWLRYGVPVVEVQRTRGGIRDGVDTRPYRFGDFDILAVCMEPSHGRWNSFHYIPERWLNPRAEDAALIEKLQPVALEPDAIWTNDFNEAVRRLRSGDPRPVAQT